MVGHTRGIKNIKIRATVAADYILGFRVTTTVDVCNGTGTPKRFQGF